MEVCALGTGQRAFVLIKVRDEVATWVSEHSMQSNSVTLLCANIADYASAKIRYICNIVIQGDP